MYKVIFFDLDDTLYPRGSSLMRMIGQRIREYIVGKLGIPADQAEILRKRWRDTYGTALRGMLEEGIAFDVEDFLRYVHDIPLDGVIHPDPALRGMLLGLPLRRAVLTNSNVEHARRVLNHMAVLDCFERIIDIRALKFVNKPDPAAYRCALDMMGVAPEETILVEDMPPNTRPAKAMGMTTILVDCPPTPDADYIAPSVYDVGRLVNQLVDGVPGHNPSHVP